MGPNPKSSTLREKVQKTHWIQESPSLKASTALKKRRAAQRPSTIKCEHANSSLQKLLALKTGILNYLFITLNPHYQYLILKLLQHHTVTPVM